MGKFDLNTNFVTKMGDDDYNNLPALRSTHLKEFIKSPRHYQYALSAEARAENDSKSHFLVGNFVHTALLEPEKLVSDYLVVDASTRNTNKYKEAKEKFPGRKIILQGEKEECEKIIAEVKKLSPVMELCRTGENELAAYAKLSTGNGDEVVACKAKLDIWLPSTNSICDVKTTSDSASDFRYRIKSFGYDVSAAYYIDVMNACGHEVDSFTFVVIEKKPPYGVMLYYLTEEDYKRGQKKYKDVLPKYLECLRTGVYPAYSLEPQPSSTKREDASE